MTPHGRRGETDSATLWAVKLQAFGLALALCAAPAAAQDAPARPPAAPAFPSVKVSITLFTDYTVNQKPKTTDADLNTVTFNAFQVTRSYINVTGNLSRHVQFRLTPDITRETGTGSSLSGSYTFRLKYAYVQFNLDDIVTAGSYARLGMQDTPWISFMDGVYRYRFQGPTFTDREAYLSSADVGASFRYAIPGNYGDVHAGIYNGETFARPELNDQKGFMVRGAVRPLPRHAVLRGLRVAGFYDKDAYVKNADRTRAIGAVTFEHPRVHAAFEHLAARDQNASATRTPVEARGWSAWVTPRFGRGWEALLRVDSLEPNRATPEQKKRRTIAGVAYWFPMSGNLQTALLFAMDSVRNRRFDPARADERRLAVHALINF
jgi:hypothetical protein